MKQVAEARATTTGKIKTKECYKCHCHVMGKIQDHLRTPEHLVRLIFQPDQICY